MAFNLKEREQRASASLGSSTERPPRPPHSPSLPFKGAPVQLLLPARIQSKSEEGGGVQLGGMIDWTPENTTHRKEPSERFHAAGQVRARPDSTFILFDICPRLRWQNEGRNLRSHCDTKRHGNVFPAVWSPLFKSKPKPPRSGL